MQRNCVCVGLYAGFAGGGTGLSKVRFNGFADADVHHVESMAFERRVRHDIIVLVNGSRLSELQKLGPRGYAEDVLRRFAGAGLANQALVQRLVDSGNEIRGLVIRMDWRSGELIETIRRSTKLGQNSLDSAPKLRLDDALAAIRGILFHAAGRGVV